MLDDQSSPAAWTPCWQCHPEMLLAMAYAAASWNAAGMALLLHVTLVAYGSCFLQAPRPCTLCRNQTLEELMKVWMGERQMLMSTLSQRCSQCGEHNLTCCMGSVRCVMPEWVVRHGLPTGRRTCLIPRTCQPLTLVLEAH